MQPWYALAGVVASALDNASSSPRLRLTETRFRAMVEQTPVVTYLDRRSAGSRATSARSSGSCSRSRPTSGCRATTAGAAHPPRGSRAGRPTGYDEPWPAARPYRYEYRLIGTDGIGMVGDEAVTVTDDQGEPTLVQGVIYDITDRKVAEQRYLEAEERYRILVEQLPLAIYIDALDEQATSLYNSPQSEQISGYSHAVARRSRPVREDPSPRRPGVGDGGFDEARLSARRLSPTTGWCVPTAPFVSLHDESVVVADTEGEPIYGRGTCSMSPAARRRRSGSSHLAYHDALTGLPTGRCSASTWISRWPAPSVRPGGRGAVRRPRRLQAGQRQLRPAPATSSYRGRRAPAHRHPRRRRGRPPGRRRGS